jgi:UDP-glucuronate decarboxylase
MFETQRILVTGGAGFIGSFLCEKLLNQGHDVICVDNMYTGSRRNIGEPAGKSALRIHPA